MNTLDITMLVIKNYFIIGISLAISKHIFVILPVLSKLTIDGTLRKCGVENVKIFKSVFCIFSFTSISAFWFIPQFIFMDKNTLALNIKEGLSE